jgi:sulfur-carrier protein
MSVQVRIPTVLRKHTNGEAAVEVEGASIRELVEQIDQKFTGFKEQIVGDDGKLHRFINVYLNDEDVRYLGSLDTEVGSGDVVSILPAVAGGRR